MPDTLWIEQARSLMTWPVESVERGRKRFAALFSSPGPDYLPIVFSVPVDEVKTFPEFNYREAFNDPDKMATNALRGALSHLRSGSDAQPAIRANTGTGTVCSLFGLQQEILPDAMPWLKQHLSKAQVSKLESVADPSDVPLMQRIKEIYAFYDAHLPELPKYIFDTQSPFDLAHLVLGDDIFYELHDDGPFVHHLMDLATEAYVRATEYGKRLLHEPLDRAYHGSSYLAAAGVRVCEDTTTLIGGREIETFVLPYSRRAMEHFGGAFVHYCGRQDALLDRLIESAPACRYVNFGNPEMHDVIAVIRRLIKRGKVYYGTVPRERDESLENYFRRVLTPLQGRRFGLILEPALNGDERTEPQKVIDLYHRVQDDMLGP